MYLFYPKISKNDSRKSFIKKLLDSILYSRGCKGNDAANCAKSMKLSIVVSYKILIRHFGEPQF